MKVYISVDMEGISGVVFPKHVNLGSSEHERFRRLMTAEVNAAIQGALAGGAEDILVNDAHGAQTNILIEELNPAARLISGVPKRFGMMHGISSEFDAAFLIGYHAMAGTGTGVLSHSYFSNISEFRLNGQVMGETGINAAMAGAFGVPVVLVCGDQATSEEAHAISGDIETVVVKHGITHTAARCLAPQVAAERIRNAAERALKLKIDPLVVGTPIKIEVSFNKPFNAEIAGLVPGCRRLNGTALEWTGKDMTEMYPAFQAMGLLTMLEAFLE